MPYVSTALNHSNTYTLDAAAASGSVAVTVVTIKTTGAVTMDSLLNPTGSRSIGNGVARIIFITNGPAGGSGTFKVTQSGNTLIDTTWGSSSPVDLEVTFNVT